MSLISQRDYWLPCGRSKPRGCHSNLNFWSKKAKEKYAPRNIVLKIALLKPENATRAKIHCAYTRANPSSEATGVLLWWWQGDKEPIIHSFHSFKARTIAQRSRCPRKQMENSERGKTNTKRSQFMMADKNGEGKKLGFTVVKGRVHYAKESPPGTLVVFTTFFYCQFPLPYRTPSGLSWASWLHPPW